MQTRAAASTRVAVPRAIPREGEHAFTEFRNVDLAASVKHRTKQPLPGPTAEGGHSSRPFVDARDLAELQRRENSV